VGSEKECRERARAICVEQTIEFPADLVWKREITDRIVARVENLTEEEGGCLATISFSTDVVGSELTQLLNVVYGNISLLPGIRVEEVTLPQELLEIFPGPGFGRAGLRELVGVPRRPLLCSALKPMGLSARELAELAGQFAAGGIDMLKDDHGLVNQSFSPFSERVRRCAETVREVNERTGSKTLYFANVTAPHPEILDRAMDAAKVGAGGLLVAPGLTGLDAMRELTGPNGPGLPVLAHPSLQGSLVVSPSHGMAHHLLFGLFDRLAGADGTIFPNYGGRFSFSEEECASIAHAALKPLCGLKPCLPAPAGGMTLARAKEMIEFYGPDVILLIGGDLHRGSGTLADSCIRFRETVEDALTSG